MYNQCFSTKLAGLQFWLSKSLFEHNKLMTTQTY